MFSVLEIIQKKESLEKKWNKLFLLWFLVPIIFSFSYFLFYFDREEKTLLCMVSVHSEKKEISFYVSIDQSHKLPIPFLIDRNNLKNTQITVNLDGKCFQNLQTLGFKRYNKNIIFELQNYDGIMSHEEMITQRKEAEDKLFAIAQMIDKGVVTGADEETFYSLLDSLYTSKLNQITYKKFANYTTFLVVKVKDLD